MTVTPAFIKGVCVIEPTVHGDQRGYLFRAFCRPTLHEAGFSLGEIVQSNISFSHQAGTFRGFHYQLPPHAEEKVVTCLQGEILDYVVDLRKGSSTFLKNYSVVLSEQNRRSILIPRGCAHGFITLQPDCQLMYLHTAAYQPAFERGVNLNEPRLGIALPRPVAEMSERDRQHALLAHDFDGIEL
ncbi:MAG: dTDP-4-dehydrorhamnose 3,5-epimerase family protein [Cyclobacteriaceae bacterium]|jgi:dTDP-4-dehydrorhamnose 3,5-epimerase